MSCRGVPTRFSRIVLANLGNVARLDGQSRSHIEATARACRGNSPRICEGQLVLSIAVIVIWSVKPTTNQTHVSPEQSRQICCLHARRSLTIATEGPMVASERILPATLSGPLN